MTDEQAKREACADNYFRPMPDSGLYAAFTGLVEGVVTDEELTDAQRVEEIGTGLAALDATLSERRALVVPHGPVRPPYGSTAREQVDRFAPVADEWSE